MPCTRSQSAVARVTRSTRGVKIGKRPNPNPGSKQPAKKTSNIAVVGNVSLTLSDVSVSPYPDSAAEVPAREIPAAEVPAMEIPAAEVPAMEIPAAEVPAMEIPAAEVSAVELPDVAGSEDRCK